MLATGIAERVADRRRLTQDLPHRRWLRGDVVEGAKGVARRLLAGGLVELAGVLLEPGPQPGEIGRPTLRVANGVQLEPVLGDAEAAEQRVVKLDHLRIERGVLGADRLDVQLPVLAEAPFLRTPVAVDRFVRVELLRLRLAMEAVLEVGAHDRGGRLRTKRERPVAAVLECVHLLRDDVRPLSGRTREELGLLEDGRVDPAIAVQVAQALELPQHVPPARLLGGEDVVGAARSFELHARSSARKGLRASSSPSVVGGPCPE